MSIRRVKIVAAFIWYAGGTALMLKGWRLLAEANTLQPDLVWPWFAITAGVLIGMTKAKLLFIRSCRKNLERIDALEHPGIWQCFRPRFFLFLLAMIMAGAILSNQAQNNYSFLIGVAVLDFSIATALYVSSYVFWRNWK
jgi:hypothetical protein